MKKIVLFVLCAVLCAACVAFADQKQDKEAILNELSSYSDKNPLALAGVVFSMGDVYSRENKTDEAIALYEKALNIFSDNEELLNRAGNLYNQKAAYDKAAAVYKKLTALKPDNIWYFQMLSNSLSMSGKKDESADVWKKLITERPEDLNILNQAATFYNNINDTNSAIPLAEKAVKLDANNIGYLQSLANLYAKAEKFDKAEEAYKKLAGITSDQWLKDWANGELLNLYQKQNKLDDLAVKLEAGLAEKPNDAGSLKMLGELYVKKGDNDKAFSVYEKAAGVSPEDRGINNKLVDLYEAQGKFNEAAIQLEKIVKIAPNELYLFERIANLYEKAGKKEESKKAWETVITKVTNDAALYLRYAEALYKSGDFNGAKAAFGKVVAEARDEWIKSEAKKRLEEMVNVKTEPEKPVTKEVAAKEEKPKQEESKKKKGWFGR